METQRARLRYGRVDRKALKKRLLDECRGATLLEARATAVDHADDAASRVTLDDGSEIEGLVVVDATGFRRRFVEHDAAFDPGFQVTYGALLRVPGGHPFALDELVLMDYRDGYFRPSGDLARWSWLCYGLQEDGTSSPTLQKSAATVLVRPSSVVRRYIGDDAAMRAANERFPTFMYVMPISEDEIFFEETVLVSRPGGDSPRPAREFFASET